MNTKIRIAVPVACLTIALICGCHKKEESAPGATNAQQKQPEIGQSFSASLPPALAGKTIPAGGKANAEYLNSKMIDKIANVKSEEGFVLLGWAINESTKSVPETLFIELAPVKGGENYYATATRYDREDVAKAYKDPAYEKAGYTVKADIKPVPPGEYEINVIQIDNGNPVRFTPGIKIDKTN